MSDSICHCGTIEESVEAAKKLIAQLTGSDCPVWAFQVASAAAYLSAVQLVHNDPEVAAEMLKAGEIVVKAASKVDINQLVAESEAQRIKLYGSGVVN